MLTLQSLVTEALIKYWLLKTSKGGKGFTNITFDVMTRRTLTPPHIHDPMFDILQDYLPIFIALSFVFNVIMNTQILIEEQENKIKVGLKEKYQFYLIYYAMTKSLLMINALDS